MQRYDLTNLKFGRLTVIEKEKIVKCKTGTRVLWRCRCDCGKTSVVATSQLTSGRTQSCGCLRAERTSTATKTHGMRFTSDYHRWQGIKDRCQNPHNKRFYCYGARGIKVCEEWTSENGFINFYECVSKLPHYGEKGYTLDRIDVDGDYTPENVRWATLQEQANNKQNTRIVEIEGYSFTISELSKIMNIKHNTLYMRLWQNRPIIYEEEKEKFWDAIRNKRISITD